MLLLKLLSLEDPIWIDMYVNPENLVLGYYLLSVKTFCTILAQLRV